MFSTPLLGCGAKESAQRSDARASPVPPPAETDHASDHRAPTRAAAHPAPITPWRLYAASAHAALHRHAARCPPAAARRGRFARPVPGSPASCPLGQAVSSHQRRAHHLPAIPNVALLGGTLLAKIDVCLITGGMS